MAAAAYQGSGGAFLAGAPATIANSAQLSSVIPLNGLVPVGILFPAAFTGTAITFEACDTLAGTYRPVCATTSGTVLSYTVAQATYQALDPKDFQGINFLKIKSGSTEGGLRTLSVSLKGI